MGWFYIFLKALQAGPSRASQNYEEAQLNGTQTDRAREGLRRFLRNILGTAILICIALGLLIEIAGKMPEDKAFLIALVLCLPVSASLWLVYYLLRFVLPR